MNQLEPLEREDQEAFLDLPFRLREAVAGQVIVEEGEHSHSCIGLLSGFTYRHRTLRNGARQIISVHVPGDFPDLQSGLLGVAIHTLQMLTPGRLALFQADELQRLVSERPAIRNALWRETLIDTSISGEWVANVGRRDARGRIAHLLCEFAMRLRAAGLLEGDSYELPMTQEQMADATGLTPVHVNRTLQEMRRAGLIHTERRKVSVADWARLAALGDFDPQYLHLEADQRS
ncbi:Crp/Fnr family transcriptional regulator [Novosphingobium sediminicola]|uniref:CRP-like cAMP-binding protein n=1 Tax=Novosphingobium sediminicola TaxID=563162 RepID=A0A7W6G932_9SPHN|nr:Crp/Fnr family transcriptional regulator [Novosphingobium sediminicola]MBB3956637.1 CRP-like cAMP-binding protein [Novosphingobium sediminicola]